MPHDLNLTMPNDLDLIDRLVTQIHRMELLAGMICSNNGSPELGNDAWDGFASMLDECADVMTESVEALMCGTGRSTPVARF